MKSKQHFATILIPAIGMGAMILDSKTALLGAGEGMEICIRTVIPSLFPFILLSILLTRALLGRKILPLRFLCKLCGIPSGAESLLAAGLLGGYPVGAQCIFQSYQSGQLKKQDAHRMLGFCNNAGPAFIFGMTGTLFSSAKYAWALWGIHILSALFVGMLLPQKSDCTVSPPSSENTSLSSALNKTLHVTANICGWVILFRIIICFFSRWFLWYLPNNLQVALIGFLELANGCCSLLQVAAEPTRFILCAAFLGFGGVCVAMQTVSVTSNLGMGLYWQGKVLQCAISIILATLTAYLLYPMQSVSLIKTFSISFVPVIFVPILILTQKKKKTVAFP